MSAYRPSTSSRGKPFAVTVVRIGTHPLVYSIVTILVVGALAFFLAVVPFVRELQSGGKASTSDAQDRNRAAQNTLDAEKKLSDAVSSLSSDDRAMLSYALPSEPDAPGLAVIMKSLAVDSGVKLVGFDATEPQAADGSGASTVGKAEINLSLELVTYDRLKIFLTNAESSLRLFDVENLSFSPSTASANIQFAAYYLNNN